MSCKCNSHIKCMCEPHIAFVEESRPNTVNVDWSMKDELARLRTENEELKKDKARLDWIECFLAKIDGENDLILGLIYRVRFRVNETMERFVQDTSLRGVLDTAMKEKK